MRIVPKKDLHSLAWHHNDDVSSKEDEEAISMLDD